MREYETRVATPHDITGMAQFETRKLLELIMNGVLPECDLSFGSDEICPRIDFNQLRRMRATHLENDQGQNGRVQIVCLDRNGQITGSGKVRIVPEEKRAVFYGNYADRNTGLHVLRASIKELEKLESEFGTTITTVSISRYEQSENSKPFFKTIAGWVNGARTDSIIIDTYKWKGHNVFRFTTSRDVFEDLVEEFAPKVSAFLS